MSSLFLRHHDRTLAYIPFRRARRIEAAVRAVQLSMSRRRFKHILRRILPV